MASKSALILFVSLVQAVASNGQHNFSNRRCVQFVHIGTTDGVRFSSVLSTDDSWCMIEFENLYDTILVKKKKFDFSQVSEIESFIHDYDLGSSLSGDAHSGYKISTLGNLKVKHFYILSKDQHDRFFDSLIEHLMQNNAAKDLILFVRDIKRRGYYFYG